VNKGKFEKQQQWQKFEEAKIENYKSQSDTFDMKRSKPPQNAPINPSR
jgi:hypothetical protein